MQKNESHLIMAATEHRFLEKQIPELYVQIQEHRASLERQQNFQVTFQDAISSWNTCKYAPAIHAIEENEALHAAFPQATREELYLALCAVMKMKHESNAEVAILLLISLKTHGYQRTKARASA